MRVARLTRLAVAGLLAVGMVTPTAAQQKEVMERPTFTPYTKKPEVRSVAEVRDALRAMYPPLLREAGIEGTAIYWLFIDRTGEVKKAELYRSSGYEELDAAAGRVAAEMRFDPALNRDRPVDVWVQVPITFSSDAAGAEVGAERGQQPARARARPGVRSEDITEAPTFTPYTEAPSLANQAEVARALMASYPPLLRDAGIGGTAQVWFLIDEDGTVVKSQLARSSGHEALDDAALAVAEQMRFHSARNRGEDVMVWIQVPVTFTAK